MKTAVRNREIGVGNGRARGQVARAAAKWMEQLEERQLLAFHVNFTAGPAGTPNTNPPVDVAGYMTDIGTGYGDRADRGQAGQSYGWIDYTTGAAKNNAANARRRGNANSGGELLDTFNHMMKPDDNTPSGWANWEIAVPNGQYQVHIASGDITATNSNFRINVEGTLIVNGIPTNASNASHFVEGTGLVTVSDGKLTVSTATGASNNKINYIDIVESVITDPPSVAPVLTALPASSKVALSWTSVPLAQSYDVYRGTASGNEALLTNVPAATTFSDTAVTVGNTYFYYVVPRNNVGTGPQSNEVSTTVHAAFAHVNFQTPTTVTPAGYLGDVGDAYGNRGNGFSYGWWNQPLTTPGLPAAPAANTAARERNNAISPDKRYDTFAHWHNGTGSPAGNNWWEIAVPNGTYQVRVVGGESDNADEYLSFYAEATRDPVTGAPLMDGSGVELIHQNMAGTTGLARWADSGFITVVVTDGTLTISEGLNGVGVANTGGNAKIDFIDIDTTTVASKPADPTLLTITDVHASNLKLNWTDNSTNETGFRIEQSPDGVTWTGIATAPAQAATGTVSYLVAGLTPVTHYYYRVFAMNLQGDSVNPTNTADTTTLTATGGNGGRVNATTGEINLSAEGALDWAHWGATDANSFDHKSGVTSLISNVTPVGSSAKVLLANSPTTFTWSDGTPTGSVTANANELGTFGFGHGFTFTVPADTTPRVLRVYVGVNNVRGQFTARLSDGSAADFVDSSIFNATATDGVYTLTYAAASAGQTLTVTWIEIPPNGDQVGGRLNLKAATLQTVPATPTGQTLLTATPLSSGRVYLTWVDQTSNGVGYNIERAPDNNGVPGAFVQLAQVFKPAGAYLDQSTLGVANTKFYYRLTPFNAVLATGTPSAVSPLTTASPLGDGAQANYFNLPGDPGLTKDPVLAPLWPVTSIDPVINFDFGTGAPAGAGAGFPVNNFIVRWTATIKPDFTGPYTFYADTDDGYRLIVNGKKLFDNLDRRGGLAALNAPPFTSPTIDLIAGQSYSLIFDQLEVGGGAGARLYWSSALLPRELIPQASMTHAALDVTPPTVTGIEFDSKLPAAVYTPAQHLLVHFSENVAASLDTADITVSSSDGFTYYTAGQLNIVYDAATNSAVVTFPGVSNATLPDGNWYFNVFNAGVTDPSGNTFDGDPIAAGNQDFAVPFYVLTGDTQFATNGTRNNDRRVGFVDFQRLELNYGKGQAALVSGADGDFNHDGVVDDADVTIFFQVPAGTFLPPPPPPPAAPVSAPAPAPAPALATPAPVKTPAAKSPAKTPVVTKAPAKAPAPVKKPPVVKTVAKVVAPPTPAKPTAFGTKRVRSLADLLN